MFNPPIYKQSSIDSILNIGLQSQKFKILHVFATHKLKQTTLNWFCKSLPDTPKPNRIQKNGKMFYVKKTKFPPKLIGHKNLFHWVATSNKGTRIFRINVWMYSIQIEEPHQSKYHWIIGRVFDQLWMNGSNIEAREQQNIHFFFLSLSTCIHKWPVKSIPVFRNSLTKFILCLGKLVTLGYLKEMALYLHNLQEYMTASILWLYEPKKKKNRTIAVYKG